MGKSLSSDNARAVCRSSKKERRDLQRRTRGSASLPAPAERLGPIISTMHTNESTLTANKGLLVSPFLDRSTFSDVRCRIARECPYQHVMPDRAGVHLYHVERAE